jgi:hypothetical protein
VVVAPVDPARAVGLAYARLAGIVAAVRPDLADQPTHTTVSLHFHFKTGLEQQVQPADALPRESQAILAHAAVRELQHETRVVLLLRALGHDAPTQRQQHRQRQSNYCDLPETFHILLEFLHHFQRSWK